MYTLLSVFYIFWVNLALIYVKKIRLPMILHQYVCFAADYISRCFSNTQVKPSLKARNMHVL